MLCSECKDGYAKQGQFCEICPPHSSFADWPKASLNAMIVLVVLAFFMSSVIILWGSLFKPRKLALRMLKFTTKTMKRSMRGKSGASSAAADAARHAIAQAEKNAVPLKDTAHAPHPNEEPVSHYPVVALDTLKPVTLAPGSPGITSVRMREELKAALRLQAKLLKKHLKMLIEFVQVPVRTCTEVRVQ